MVLLGGRPLREPVAWSGPFVMNTREEVMDAFRDFQKGRLGAVPAERVPHAGASRGVRDDVGATAASVNPLQTMTSADTGATFLTLSARPSSGA